jgi:hypothetical protein
MKLIIRNTHLVANVPTLRALEAEDMEIKVVGTTIYQLKKLASSGLEPSDHGGYWTECRNPASIIDEEDDAFDPTGHLEILDLDPIATKYPTYLPGNEYEIDELVTDDLKGTDPRNINYKTQLVNALFPKRTFDKGHLIKVEYYKEHDIPTNTFTGLVLTVDVVYDMTNAETYQSSEKVNERTTTRTWRRRNGKMNSTKVTKKHYSDITLQREEGKRRRTNIFNLVSVDLVTCLTVLIHAGDQQTAENDALVLMAAYNSEVSQYFEVGGGALITAINDDAVFGWLDTVVPDVNPINLLVPDAVGGTIRAHVVEMLKGNR